MTTEDAPGPVKDARTHVSPDPGFYADPGGQAGTRYWNGREWSPLFSGGSWSCRSRESGELSCAGVVATARTRWEWQYAAGMARKAGVSTALYAALAVLLLAVALVVQQVRGLGAIGLLSALRTLGQWRMQRRWIKLDRAATGLVGTGDSTASPGGDLGEGVDAP